MKSSVYKVILRCSALLVSFYYSGTAVAENFVLETENMSMAFSSEKDALNLRYFGAKVADSEDLFAGGSSVPEFYSYWDTTLGRNGNEFGYSIVQADGTISSKLVFIRGEKQKLNEDQVQLSFHYKDPAYDLTLTRHYLASYESDIIETWSELIYSGEGAVRVERLSSFVLNTSAQQPYLTGFNGTWARESLMNESPLMEGTSELSGTTGARVAQTANPSFILSLDGPAREDTGRVVMGSLAWSGNFAFRFRRSYDNKIRASLGYHPMHSAYQLAKGETLVTPRLILTYSGQGKGAATRAFHRWARQYGIRGGNTPRMILLNSWEGAYFKFNQNKIYGMMERASSMGVELFVLDDGWFGEGKFARNSDKAGLGDWQVNREKLPDGIDGLIRKAEEFGIQFGIWVEPEMVNPKSQLYTDHPEWTLQLPNREERMSRNQLVLDLCNPAVQDYIFTMMDQLLSSHPDICYIKWDCNSHVINPGSTWLPDDKQSHLWIDYVKGYYSVLDRLIKEHPKVVFQACSSGGGRVDYGAMQRHHEFWTSDNTDALDRIYMQWSIGHFYPAIAMASHVTATPNHQTGRSTPLKFRFDVAMAGRLGFELDPKNLNPKEVEFCKDQLAVYKEIRPVVQLGDLYRLRDPDQNADPALMYLLESEGKQTAILFAYLLNRKKSDGHEPVCLKGLKPNARYVITELGSDKRIPYHGKAFSGQYLIRHGIPMNWPRKGRDYLSRVIQIKEMN
ncbi:alpha-galactosidase [Pontiellaceae bacterium B12227]|nr:alpha-galactosidase [Pontiellaceae bacterium B12227]